MRTRKEFREALGNVQDSDDLFEIAKEMLVVIESLEGLVYGDTSESEEYKEWILRLCEQVEE